MLAGERLRAAEEGEVDAVEGAGDDGLDKGDFIAHLVKLALGLLVVEQNEVGRRQGRLRERLLQLPAHQGRGSGNGDLKHRRSFVNDANDLQQEPDNHWFGAPGSAGFQRRRRDQE